MLVGCLLRCLYHDINKNRTLSFAQNNIDPSSDRPWFDQRSPSCQYSTITGSSNTHVDSMYDEIKDFIQSREMSSKAVSPSYELSDRLLENGGRFLSPCFASRIRSVLGGLNLSASGGGGASNNGVGGGVGGGTIPSTDPTRPHCSCDHNNIERQLIRTLTQVNRMIETNEMRRLEVDRREVIKTEWQQVAVVVDRILLFVFIVVTVGVTLFVLLCAPHSWSFIFGGADDDGILKVAQSAQPPNSTDR